MASEHRLHPSSIIFSLGQGLIRLAFPGLVAFVTAGSTGWLWQPWLLALAIPAAVFPVLGYFTFRYRYESDEMVIRSGLIFRNERHVPYARIQNLDATQNVFHRLLGVAEVRVETGAGNEPEARMAVLPLGAIAEMRRRVFAERAQRDEALAESVVQELADRPLLELSAGELMRCGLIERRGLVVMAAAVGGLWQLGLTERVGNLVFGRVLSPVFGDWTFGAGEVRGAASSWPTALSSAAAWSVRHLVAILVLLAVGTLLVVVLSMAWAFIRLYGFRLVRVGADLRTEYGLLTRVTATIPLTRIQTLTIHEGPWHRLMGRVSVSVDTAGGNGPVRDGGGQNAPRREGLAPILRRQDLAAFVGQVLPALDLPDVEWRRVHPRAFWRRLKPSIASASIGAVPFVVVLGWSGLAVVPVLLCWGLLSGHKHVNHLGWALTDSAVCFRSGWIWRNTTVAPFSKIQVATLLESPFDRRAAMATVSVDAAGAGQYSHRVTIPYLGREVAADLHAALSARAAGTEFRW